MKPRIADSVTCTFENGTVKIAFVNSMARMKSNPTDSRGLLTGKAA